MKRVVIVHCWDGYPEYCWYPYVKRELEEKGYEVLVPAFPETEMPKLAKWLPVLKEAIGEPDEDTYLIGHSIGCATILRYLEMLPEGEKIGGAVLVAGYTDDLGFKEISNFFEIPIDLEKIKTRANHFVAIHSDDDPYVPLKHGDIFKEKLEAELIIKHNTGHFSGSDDEESTKSCTELPDVVNAVLRMSQ